VYAEAATIPRLASTADQMDTSLKMQVSKITWGEGGTESGADARCCVEEVIRNREHSDVGNTNYGSYPSTISQVRIIQRRGGSIGKLTEDQLREWLQEISLCDDSFEGSR
jgi:hypothetical protein